jgi:hypothetical protein
VQIIQSCYFHAWFFAEEPSSWLLGPKSKFQSVSVWHLLHALDGMQTLIATSCTIFSYMSYFGRAVEVLHDLPLSMLYFSGSFRFLQLLKSLVTCAQLQDNKVVLCALLALNFGSWMVVVQRLFLLESKHILEIVICLEQATNTRCIFLSMTLCSVVVVIHVLVLNLFDEGSFC